MAIPWLAVLKMVPWTDVVKNAPVVADGAKKLWTAVARKSSQSSPKSGTTSPINSGRTPEDLSLPTLASRLATLDSVTTELHEQMVTSSNLIEALAEQNAQLVLRIDALRRRVIWLAAVVVVLGILTVRLLAST
jgi:hypothetical protein